MSRRFSRADLIAAYSFAIGLSGWVALLSFSSLSSLQSAIGPLFAFSFLSLVVKRMGFHVARDVTHSLVGVVDLAAIFALGPVLGGWVAALSALAYLELHALRRRLLAWRFVVEQPLFSSGLMAWMGLGAGAVYRHLGGAFAPQVLTWDLMLPLFSTLAFWFLADHTAWALRTWLRTGTEGTWIFLRRIMTYSLTVELLPLPFSMVLTLTYAGMGQPAFVLVALALVGASAAVQRLSQLSYWLQRHLHELQMLNDLGRALMEAQLDTTELVDLLYEYSHKVIHIPLFSLELIRPGTELTDVVIRHPDGEREQLTELAMSEALRWLTQHCQPFLYGDRGRGVLPFALPPTLQQPRSLIMVPLLAGQQLIGALSVFSREELAFQSDEVDLLSMMANQAAMAIVNARTFEEEQRKSRQLEAISQVSRRVAAILDLDRLFAEVVQLVQRAFSYDHVAIFTVDDQSEVTFRAGTSPSVQQKGVTIPAGLGIVGSVIQSGQPVLANDVNREPRYLADDALPETRSELAVALKVEERIVGILDVQSNRTAAFGQDDLFTLQTLADQIAIAVEDARLYAARQEEAWASTALLQVAEAVGSLDNLDAILETVVRLAPMLVGVDRCSILLWDEDTQEFVATRGHSEIRDRQPPLEGLRIQHGQVPLLDQIRQNKQPIFVSESENRDLIPPQMMAPDLSVCLLALPLRAQAELHGVMVADCLNPQKQFSERRRAILTGIAHQAAMAIANARLNIAQREEAWVSTALLQVSQAVVSSPDLRDNVSKIARLTPMLIGVDRCMVLLWESDTQEFIPLEAQGLDVRTEAQFYELRLPVGAFPLLDATMQSKKPTAVEDARDGDLIPEDLRRSLRMCCALCLPLQSKGQTVGILLADYADGPRRFSSRLISIAEGIAYQMALAIENARLYETTIEQERVGQELRLAREIQVSFLPERCPQPAGWEIAADWRAARGVGGDFYDFIELGEDRLGLVIADVSDKGVPAALFMSLSRTLVRASASESRSPARVLQRVNELITTETRSNMFVSLFYGVLNLRTGNLTYANAGHNPPVLWRKQGHPWLLTAHGIVLGILDKVDLEEREVTMKAGELLILHTDGVTEPINDLGEEFGDERLVRVIAAASTQTSAQVVGSIGRAVFDFVGGQPTYDDYTLVVVRRQ